MESDLISEIYLVSWKWSSIYCIEYKKCNFFSSVRCNAIGNCIIGNRKMALFSSPVTKTMYRKPASHVNCFEVQLGGVKPSWDPKVCHVDHLYPFPPHVWPYWYAAKARLYILNAEELFLSTHCRCQLVLWHTGFHCIIILIISNFISLLHLTLRKSKLNLF